MVKYLLNTKPLSIVNKKNCTYINYDLTVKTNYTMQKNIPQHSEHRSSPTWYTVVSLLHMRDSLTFGCLQHSSARPDDVYDNSWAKNDKKGSVLCSFTIWGHKKLKLNTITLDSMEDKWYLLKIRKMWIIEQQFSYTWSYLSRLHVSVAPSGSATVSSRACSCDRPNYSANFSEMAAHTRMETVHFIAECNGFEHCNNCYRAAGTPYHNKLTNLPLRI